MTKCQQNALDDIDKDFKSGTPMSRILIGSVGFGKTEVALRSAFEVAHKNKQVVIIAPSKILVEQHVNTFKKRFGDTGLTVVQVPSGYKSKSFLKSLENGEANIIIGTQARFQKR